MISREDFRPLWERLERALGRPPHSDLRLHGLYDETKHMDVRALRFAVSCWIQGSGPDKGIYARFPVPADLLRLGRGWMQGRATTAVVSKFPQIVDLKDIDLMAYASLLEKHHRSNWERWKRLRKQGSLGTGVGILAMDGLLKQSYGAVRNEFDKRFGKEATMPTLQKAEDGTTRSTQPEPDVPRLSEDFSSPVQRGDDGDSGQSTLFEFEDDGS